MIFLFYLLKWSVLINYDAVNGLRPGSKAGFLSVSSASEKYFFIITTCMLEIVCRFKILNYEVGATLKEDNCTKSHEKL